MDSIKGSKWIGFRAIPFVKLSLFAMIIAFISCDAQKPERENLTGSYPFLSGKWSGTGKFLDVGLAKELGNVDLYVEIRNDNTVLARIGNSSLLETSIEKTDKGFEIKGLLDKPLSNNKNVLKKDHLIILLVNPVQSGNGVFVSDANFHLKSNYTFDFSMRVGGVVLSREQ